MKQQRLGLILLTLFSTQAVVGYEGPLHQQLTFIAAQQYNQCVSAASLELPLLSPLQVRYMARANVQQAQSNVFSRMFRWSYYDRSEQGDRSWMWVIDTRFHAHFSEVSERLNTLAVQERAEAVRFSDLGRIMHYVQTVTSPAHAVPVYTGRWWRLSMSDRFDEYRLDQAAVREAVSDRCDWLDDTADSFEAVLSETANTTLRAVVSPIDGMPASWTDFWRPARKESNFGDYGPAGNNFGEATRFRCDNESRCVLLRDDPLYQSFAQQRHIDAVLGSMRVMRLAARSTAAAEAEIAQQEPANPSNVQSEVSCCRIYI